MGMSRSSRSVKQRNDEMATRTRRLAGEGIGIDTRQFGAFVRASKKAAPLAHEAAREVLDGAGILVANRAKEIVGKHSSSIPPTIKVARTGATVKVRAGDPDVPLAVLYEVGNKKNPLSSTFRHPVFADKDEDRKQWKWVSQNRYPFLHPAARDELPKIEDALIRELDKAIDMLAHGD